MTRFSDGIIIQLHAGTFNRHYIPGQHIFHFSLIILSHQLASPTGECTNDEPGVHAACSAPVHAALSVVHGAAGAAAVCVWLYGGGTGAKRRSVVTQPVKVKHTKTGGNITSRIFHM
jgi:hypothetical protein